MEEGEEEQEVMKLRGGRAEEKSKKLAGEMESGCWSYFVVYRYEIPKEQFSFIFLFASKTKQNPTKNTLLQFKF